VSDDDFFERIDYLQELVGSGDLVGQVVVDQVYAQAQHNSTWVSGPMAGHVIRNHPQGGGPLYLTAPLLERASLYLDRIADGLLDEGPIPGMKEAVDDLIAEVALRAPIWLDNLRQSASGTVSDDGAEVYNRAAIQRRLTAEELKALAKAHQQGKPRKSVGL
jgi:hypothetical protein